MSGFGEHHHRLAKLNTFCPLRYLALHVFFYKKRTVKERLIHLDQILDLYHLREEIL